ncbi:MAG: Asp-tRNA(Asn)/Glu-tRNA(Gln) amidotransferase subunit GatB [Acidimicrobiia bacterium]|nr:Asp-tRNA(Asn)/Glu-tRNA(Gln) amidotransferase subunit GatB [bacterium]MXW57894.1 Asp-tRNA(Asn)/Glu-tRNA(Gln) amidotransferase subunit GatB [Acidimicrobiia bacterium]MYB73985.1 Asp-tRNA(Asn)/Glu-tRNA(Gln) amidotransferase subunit GatB [Acidimicrobiia bacterium]MYH98005.1 Asp-tRNA(Asn)/Glu-tRNA(Gln) amidotransferase subunit GatB [Acidimicrobiia bacterium]
MSADTLDVPGLGAPADTDWETVVGLEVHAELATETKLFSASPNRFGGEPNTHIDPVSLGLPGSLPVLNEKAVELAIRVGLSLNCRVQPSIFARKNYFYPDMPKDFQISQYDQPINVDGWLELPSGKRVGIERAHLEEDTGKTVHIGGGGRIHEAGYSLVDYNRAGVPLIEIVGHPELRSAEEARQYVTELRSILVAVGASDGKMEEGSLRVDCNVSVRPLGIDRLGTRCEIKNVNSLRSLGRAIEYESRRQIDQLISGHPIEQQTRHWNEDDGRTHALRSKEEDYDYRYFPEPDLLPLDPSAEWVEQIRQALPVLPRDRRQSLAEAAPTVEADHIALAVERSMDELALAAISGGGPSERVMTHVIQNLADGVGVLSPESLASLVAMEEAGELTATQAKKVLAVLVESGGSPQKAAQSLGFEAMDSGELETLVDGLISEHPDEWSRFCEGDNKLTGFFVGQVMKTTQGRADGKAVTQLLNARRG